MKYSVNVCDACIKQCKGKDCNVNDINNCVYETATAFIGIPSSNALTNFDYDSLKKDCSDCVAKYVAKMGPFPNMTACDKKINPPPVFANVPNYLPELLEKHTNLEDAKNECIERCNQYAINKNECIERCIVQADAVEPYEDTLQNPIKTPQNPIKTSLKTISILPTSKTINAFIGLLFLLLIIGASLVLVFVRK